MGRKINKYLGVLIIFSILAANTALSFAQSDMESFSLEATNDGGIFSNDFEDEFNFNEEILNTELSTDNIFQIQGDESVDELPPPPENLEKQELFLNRIKDELNFSKTDYRQLLTNISDMKEKLKNVSEEMMTLEEQLENLDVVIGVTTEKLINVIKQVIEKENEIALIYEQIEIKQIALEYQKTLLKDYIRVIYQEENNYFTFNDDGDIDAFKLLLADGSVGENLKEIEYFDLLNEAGQQMIDKLEELTIELNKHKIRLNQEKEKLVLLQVELETEKERLEFQKESKENLLKLTQGQEEIYSQLLEQTIEEQEVLLNDIKNLGNAVAFIEKKIAEEGSDFNPDDYLSLLDYKNQALYNFQLNTDGLNSNGFMWPADPDRGISAYFRDSGYVGVFGVQHNAIDIPIYQGSIVRAAADGVVYTTRDNGYGYSYIILAHADGFMTVYGHISNILVEEGLTVSQGAVIGLSGGMPGTYGAGYMTTGPHLHFEMLLNGLYVDPMDYLPLEVFTEEQAEDLPEKYFDDWEYDFYQLDEGVLR